MQLGSTVAASSLNDALEKRLGIEEAQKWMSEQGAAYRELMTYYTCALMEVETKFKVLNEEFNIDGDTNPVESIKTRVK